MIIHMIIICIYLTHLGYSYNNFNQLKNDMEMRVSSITAAAEKIYQQKCNDQTFHCPVKSFNICEGTGERDCLNTFPTNKLCNGQSRFSMSSGIRIPNSYSTMNLTQQIKFYLCKSAEPQLQNVLQNLIVQNSKRYSWTGFGSNSGATRVSPGFKFQKEQNTQSCRNFDPRLRPWYASNVYQRKKMVILVQNSRGIHDRPNRYPSIQLSLKALLKTSELSDMFNVIQFSDSPRAFLSQKELKLVSLKDQIQKFNQRTKTEDFFYQSLAENITKSRSFQVNYQQALKMAVKMLQNSRQESSELENLIIMFSGFKPTNYSKAKQNQISNLLVSQKKRLNINFTFFGFGVNMLDPEGVSLLSSLACSFDGIYIPISDILYESVFLDQALPYYEFLSQGNEVLTQMWTDFYEDAFGLGKVVTVVKAAYYVQKNVTRLIGVAAIDVLLQQLTLYKTQDQIRKDLQHTQPPFRKNISLCNLQTIRRQFKCFNAAQIQCADNSFCKIKIQPSGEQVIRSPVDSSDLECCALEESSDLGLILGLSIGISGGILLIVLLVYLLICRKKQKNSFDETYKQIFQKFKDFDQTRVRSDSQISLIKE